MIRACIIFVAFNFLKVSEYNQEMPQSHCNLTQGTARKSYRALTDHMTARRHLMQSTAKHV